MPSESVKLSSGYNMPKIGLGTYTRNPEEMETAVYTALENGYRHIDTAFSYKTEKYVGKALKKWFENGGKRENLFITSKLPTFANRPKMVKEYIQMSLKDLNVDYVDMYLIHAPFAFVKDEHRHDAAKHENGTFILDVDTNPVSVWKEMEELVEKGLAKSIGLSNFNQNEIQEIWDNAEIKPSNLQVECHVLLQQKSLLKFCKNKNIAMTAFSPLGSPANRLHYKSVYNYTAHDFPDLLQHPTVMKIASNHNKASTQVLLRYLLQHGMIVIPKSSNPEHIKQNIDIFYFSLNEEEVKELEGLDKGSHGRIFNFLFFTGVQNHPYYPFKDELEFY